MDNILLQDMEKISKIFIIIAVFVIAATILLSLLSCTKEAGKTISASESKNLELKKTACYSAEASGNCMEKLSTSNVATMQECCELFSKCC
jgi:hypothetical protein